VCRSKQKQKPSSSQSARKEEEDFVVTIQSKASIDQVNQSKEGRSDGTNARIKRTTRVIDRIEERRTIVANNKICYHRRERNKAKKETYDRL
jgi:hypothetical protein